MTEKKKTVYLVDGSSYIYRAYHAIRNLANSKGFPTNAVFGFTKMVLKLIEEKAPEYLAVVFDAKGPTFRHELYKDYKANRPPMPEDLAVQIPVIKRVAINLGLKMIERQGYEADDIIGTLAKYYETKGFNVLMVTGDKDFRQLITPNISMLDTMKDKTTAYPQLKKEFGFEPEKFIDVMSLSGDRVDNIPGVLGVGEKTAVKLIKEFGTLENIFEHVTEIKGKKLKENLQNDREEAFLSRKLVTIDCDVPLGEELLGIRVGEPKGEELVEIFREAEFKGLWEQFFQKQEAPNDYHLCLTRGSLLKLVEEIRRAGIVSVDTETTSKDALAAKLVGISFCCDPNRAYYLPISHQYAGAPDQMSWLEIKPILKGVLEDQGIRKVGQNIKYDAEVLHFHGIVLKGIHFDTMVASYIINPGLRQHNLDYLSQHYLNHKMISYQEVVGKGRNASCFSEVDVETAMAYSCEDADMTLRLAQILGQKVKEDQNESLFYDLEMRLLPVLMDMELTGVRIDSAFYNSMSARFAEQMETIKEKIYSEAGLEFNINSPQQLGHVLFEKLQLPVQKKTFKTKRYSTDVRVLQKLSAMAFEIPKLVLRYRTLSKLKSTYLDALVRMVNPSTGRVHTSYNQTVTATGRLSSSDPNLQNIPIRGEEGREIRKGFVAEKGCLLVAADYSQVELRVFAHYSGDKAFLEAFQKGEDIHTRTALEILGKDNQEVDPEMRRIAKAINFGIIYGMGPRKLSEELGLDLKTSKMYIESYYERYKGVTQYREEMIDTAQRKGYVETLFGRRRYLLDIQHSNRVIRAEAERMAINTPIQGTAADLIKKAMINIYHRLNNEGFRSKMILQVHDELVFEVPEEEVESVSPLIVKEMESVYDLKVPLRVDVNRGRNWDEAH